MKIQLGKKKTTGAKELLESALRRKPAGRLTMPIAVSLTVALSQDREKGGSSLGEELGRQHRLPPHPIRPFCVLKPLRRAGTDLNPQRLLEPDKA